MLTQHPWPGSVRELSKTIQKAMIFNRGAPIRPEDIQQVTLEKRSGKGMSDEKEDGALKHKTMDSTGTVRYFPGTFI
jgi:DNA-binding NtrC family response regulator